MECAILNYNIGNVELITVPDNVEDVEEYLCDSLNYNLDEIEYMFSDSLTIEDDRE